MSTRANLVEIQAFSQYIHTLAADAGYHVYFDINTGSSAYSTATEIHLNKLHENLTHDDLMTVRGQVVRQVGHKLFTDFNILHRPELQKKKDDTPSAIKSIWMDLEDHRVDYLSIHKLGYEGDKTTLGHTEEEIQQAYLKDLKEVEGKQLDNDSLASLVTASISLKGREEFLPEMGIYADELDDIIDKIPDGKRKAIARIRKRLPELLHNRAITDPITGSLANLELARKIVQDSKQEDDKEDQPNDAMADGDGSEEGEKDEGETVARPQSTDLDEDHKGEPAENNDVAMKDGHIAPLSSPDEMLIYSYTTGKGEQGPKWDNSWTTANLSSCDRWDNTAERNYKRINDIMSECAGQQLQNEVRRILQVRSQCVRTYNRKRGKLAGKDAYRVTMQDAPGFNERVFMRQQDGISLDVAVSLLVDYSGSMDGDKIHNAVVATQLLSDTLKTLDIRHEVAGFSSGADMSVTHLLFKEFHGQEHDLTRTMCKGIKFLQMNSDGDNVLIAANRLRAQREKRRVLIVLSDGQPASYKPGNDYELLQHSINALPDMGIEVIGIGICTSHGKDVYPVWETLKSARDLEQGLLNVLRNTVFKL